MTVYVDELRVTRRTGRWPYDKSCHLTADTPEELHEFARGIGLKREWFQAHPTFPHYDLTAKRRLAAIRAGAVEEFARDAVKRIRGTT